MKLDAGASTVAQRHAAVALQKHLAARMMTMKKVMFLIKMRFKNKVKALSMRAP